MIRFQFLIFIFFVSGFLYSQNLRLDGYVKEAATYEPLFGVNLIATPLGEGEEKMTFAITDDRGAYRLTLAKDINYKLAISSVGFSTIQDTVQLSHSTTKDYILEEDVEELEAVIIKAEMAMLVQGDSITYRTDQFRTGEERKLRELLKNLPGVEVDRAGNVKVNGKTVTDFMVDGKSFFGGDAKLGVNNIPADVVNEVEVVDDYHEVSFMKGLEQSDRLAMNIKLKEGRNRFVFGEIQAGGGVQDRYLLHPSLFYYSPKTTVNLIGSLNNINESPLSFSDILRFKGGLENRMDQTVHTSNSGLNQFSSSQDIQHNKTEFAAINVTQEINDKLRLEAYSIFNHLKSKAFIQNEIEYLSEQLFVEERETRTENKGLNILNNLKLRYKPKTTRDISYSLNANLSNQEYFNTIASSTVHDRNQTLTQSDPHDFELSQYFRLNSQPKFEHTSRLTVEHNFKIEKNNKDWWFNRPVFSNLIPFEEDESYNFLQDYISTVHTGRLEYKHYWVVAPMHHIYPITGYYFYQQDYETEDYQLLHDGSFNRFDSAGFNNRLDYEIMYPYVGFQYKTQVGRVTFRPGVIYHHYFWKVNQFEEQLVQKNKGLWLPQLLVELKYRSHNLKLNYNLKSTFEDAKAYANRYSLSSFNQLYQGNENVENSVYHAITFNYQNLSRIARTMYHVQLGYNRKKKSIKQTTLLEGIDQIQSIMYSNIPENNYNASASFSKSWSAFSLATSIQAGFSDYNQWINYKFMEYQSKNYGYQIAATSWKEGWPNVRLGISQFFINSQSESYQNKYWTANPFVELSYKLGGFIMRMDYNFTYNKQVTARQSESYDMANASLYYNKEDSPWGFEIRMNNLFNIQYKRNHSFNQFMIYDRWTYIQPRVALFVLSYNL